MPISRPKSATLPPMRPMPTTPSTAPSSDVPMRRPIPNSSRGGRVCISASSSAIRRASAVISAMASSAVGIVTHSGVLTTGMPRAVAAATSMAS